MSCLSSGQRSTTWSALWRRNRIGGDNPWVKWYQSALIMAPEAEQLRRTHRVGVSFILPLLMLAGCAGPAPVRQATVEPAAFTPTEEPPELPPEAPPPIQPEPAAPLPEGTTVLHVGSSSAGGAKDNPTGKNGVLPPRT